MKMAYHRAMASDYQRKQWRAQQEIWRAVKAGKVEKPLACQGCGREAKLHAHHTDYDKPLDVAWICSKCHGKRHRAPAETIAYPEHVFTHPVLVKYSCFHCHHTWIPRVNTVSRCPNCFTSAWNRPKSKRGRKPFAHIQSLSAV